MAPSENAPHNPGLSALAAASHAAACLSASDPHILREQISEQLDELAVKEKELLDSISRKRLELNRLWNASLLIHRLPNELLVQIFTHFPDVPFSSSKPAPWWSPSHEYVSGRTGWHRLMLVCLHWRTVFLSTPTFWRVIDLERHVEWTNLCLTRSAAASIDVRAEGKSMIITPIELLQPHAHRFKTLRLYTPYNPQWKMTPGLLLESLPSYMPLLEELLLQGHRGPHFGARITFQRFPRLRNLALSQTVVPADVSLFAQLRVLTLSFCSYDFSFDVFLDILAASVQLENLTLYGALSYPSDEWLRGDPSTTSPISIPRLRKLTMENHSIVHTSRFLAHVHLPPTVSLLIIGDYEAELSPLNAMLPPNRSATLPILAIATEVAMTVQGDDYRLKLICDAPQPLPVPNQLQDASAPSRRPDASLHAAFALLRSDYDEWDPFMAQGLEDLVESLGQSPLTQLTVTGDHGHATADAWERVFRTFPGLEVLKISGDPCSHVTDVFRGLHAASTARADSESQSSVACWGLRRIEVEGLGVVETYAAMEECFRYRSDKGVVVKVLDLENLPDAEGLIPQVRDAFVKDLSKVVECVQVFDDEQESDERESDGSASNGSESDDSEM